MAGYLHEAGGSGEPELQVGVLDAQGGGDALGERHVEVVHADGQLGALLEEEVVRLLGHPAQPLPQLVQSQAERWHLGHERQLEREGHP